MAKKMYYTEEDAAAKLGVDAAALEALVQDQKLRVFKDGDRSMFRVDEIDELAAKGRRPKKKSSSLPPRRAGPVPSAWPTPWRRRLRRARKTRSSRPRG